MKKPKVKYCVTKDGVDCGYASTIIKQNFEDLWALASHKDAPPVQKQESERMFFAGAATCFAAFVAASDTLTEDQAGIHLANIRQEIGDYFKLLSKVPSGLGKN